MQGSDGLNTVQKNHKHLLTASRKCFGADFSTRTKLLHSQLQALWFCHFYFEWASSPFPHSLCSCGRDGSVKHACESHPRHLSLHYTPSLSGARRRNMYNSYLWLRLERGRVHTRSPSHSLMPQTSGPKTFHSLNLARCAECARHS